MYVLAFINLSDSVTGVFDCRTDFRGFDFALVRMWIEASVSRVKSEVDADRERADEDED